MFENVSEAYAENLLESVLSFRASWERYTKPDEVNALLGLFPKVSLKEGHALDYIQEISDDGIVLPIRPFVRPASDPTWVPLVDAAEEPHRADLADELYQYLDYENSPEGLFEYAFFVIELWAVRASSHAVEWADSTPIFTSERFDKYLAQASKVTDLRRPQHFGPLSRRDEDGGGRVRFLVYTPAGWERIYYLESMAFSDGFVDQEAGEIVADLGLGQIF